jgi:hypothetical protein
MQLFGFFVLLHVNEICQIGYALCRKLSTIWFSSTNADPEVVRAAFRADAIGYVS